MGSPDSITLREVKEWINGFDDHELDNSLFLGYEDRIWVLQRPAEKSSTLFAGKPIEVKEADNG